MDKKKGDSNDFAQQICRLFQRDGELYQERRYREAIAVVTQCRDLACRYLGQDRPAHATRLHILPVSHGVSSTGSAVGGDWSVPVFRHGKLFGR